MTAKAKKRKAADPVALKERLTGDRQRRPAEDSGNRDPKRPTLMAVTIDDLVPYDKNPRRKKNPKYDDIKASIRQRGLDDPPEITRRPDAGNDAPYMMKRGGNTRLQILHELYEETGDRKFYSIKCMFHPWVSEIDALVGHLVENDARGQMILRDRGYAAKEWMAMMPEEVSSSLRKTASAMTEQGWKIDHSNLGILLYAVDELDPFVPSTLDEGAGVSFIRDIRTLQNKYKQYWESIEALGEPATKVLQTIWENALKAHNDPRFNMQSFREEMDHNIAEAFDLDVSVVSTEIHLMLNGAKPSGVRPLKESFGEAPTMTSVSRPTTAPAKPVATEIAAGAAAQPAGNESGTEAVSQTETQYPSVFNDIDEASDSNDNAETASAVVSTVQSEPATVAQPELATHAQASLSGLDRMQAPVYIEEPAAQSLTVPELQQACYDVAHRMVNLVQMPECVLSMKQLNQPQSGFGFHLLLPDGMTDDLQRLTLVHLFYCFHLYGPEGSLNFGFEELLASIGGTQMQEFWAMDFELLKLRQHPSIASNSPTVEHQLVVLMDELNLLIGQLRHRTHDLIETLWHLEGQHG